MTNLFANMEFWHWWVLAICLVILEVFAPGAFFLWMGVSAVVVGLLLWLFPSMGWEAQMLVFSVLSVVAVVSWRFYLKKYPTQSDEPKLNRRGQRYVGRTFTLDSPIVNGVGKIKVDDSTWKVEGPEMVKGAHVKVTGVSGVVLTVEPAGDSV